MGRILIVPSISKTSVVDNVGYQELYSFTETLKDLGEQAYWYILVPTWVKDGLKGHKNIHYVYVDSTRDSMLNDMVGYPALELARYFSRRGGSFIVDAAITNCSGFAYYLRRLLSDPFKKEHVPVFLRDDIIFDGHSDDPERWISAASNLSCCHLAARSVVEQKYLIGKIGKYVMPSVQRMFLDNSVLWPAAYSKSSVTREGDITLFFGGNFEHSSMTQKVLGVYSKLNMVRGIKSVFATMLPKYKADKTIGSKSDFFKSINSGLSLSEYREHESMAHVFISSVSDNGDCVGILHEEKDRMMRGQIGIFPATNQVYDAIGEDYPYLYNSFGDSYALAEWMIDNYDKASMGILDRVNRWREESSPMNSAKVMWGHISDKIKTAEAHVGSSEDKLSETVGKVANALGGRFALDVFLDILEEHITWLKPWGRKGTLKEFGYVAHGLPTLYDIRLTLSRMGWIDTCDGKDIFMRKCASNG